MQQITLKQNSSKNKSRKYSLKEQVPNLLYKIMILLFIGIFAYSTFLSNFNSASVLVYAAFMVFVAVKFFSKHYDCFDNTSTLKLLTVLSLSCFIVKFLWIYFVRLDIAGDYATFYGAAVSLSESWVWHSRYIALFPHILGYSTFLSILFKIFGESVFLATLINVFLSVISGILIYKITKKLVSATAAVFAYALWIICPSQTIYNSMVLSDPFYTTFLLAFVYLIISISQKEISLSTIKMSLFGALAGILLQSINVNRPIAMILIIAVFIWIFVLRFNDLFNKKFLLKWIPFLSAMLAIYFIFGCLWNVYFTSRFEEAPASVPGYNIHVGFNESSGGTWNPEDSELLFYYSDQDGATAEWAQQQMLKEAKARITSGTINFTKLFKSKLVTFIGEDSACVRYCNDAIKEPEYMSMISDSFYYFLILLSILGAYKMLKVYHKSAAFILPLYVIGIVCAQMLVEVASRYHYSIIPFLIIIPQFYLFKNRKEANEK